MKIIIELYLRSCIDKLNDHHTTYQRVINLSSLTLLHIDYNKLEYYIHMGNIYVCEIFNKKQYWYILECNHY